MRKAHIQFIFPASDSYLEVHLDMPTAILQAWEKTGMLLNFWSQT